MDPASYEAALKAALSGFAFGAPVGAVGRILGGGKKLSDIMKTALVGGGMGAGAAGGSTLVGSAMLGPPDTRTESSPYTTRGAIGGLVGGGGTGATLGALASTGLLSKIARGTPGLSKSHWRGWDPSYHWKTS